MTISLNDSIQYLKGVGPARAEDFAKLGVLVLKDLLYTFPRDISDRSNICTIADITENGENVIMGVVEKISEHRPRGRLKHILKARIYDGTGYAEATWFNAQWIREKIEGSTLIVYGKFQREGRIIKISHPQYEIVPQDGVFTKELLSVGRMVPLYPCKGRLTQTVWRKVMDAAIKSGADLLGEIYPEDFLRSHDLMRRSEAVKNMHFPDSEEDRKEAIRRLAYDESIFMQLAILVRRKGFESAFPGRSFSFSRVLNIRIRKLFPFRLTAAQEVVVSEIVEDMQSAKPMHRLVQGDVGSGKTAVAIFAMLVAVAGKTQVCMMAPTGLLARQHYQTVISFLESSDKSSVRVKLLSSGITKSERELIKAELASGGIDILIATHSVIQSDIEFKNLGLVVIDEQHKFGVQQRERLVSKGIRPDIIVMTATPIPRSLALTVYGDLDVSVIDSLPPGRKPVKTSLYSVSKQTEVWGFVRQELAMGRQAYVVSPLLEENDDSDLTSAKEAYEDLVNGEFSGYKVGLMHGKMKRDEQLELMTKFRNNKINLLVSTVVVEVGVDVKNANTMVVLHANRFGLAQLHQLRGRVGRGEEQGYFIMVSDAKNQSAIERLSVLANTTDGFVIAQEDLRMRGPGEFLGVRQHGLPELKVLDISKDFEMIKETKTEAVSLHEEILAGNLPELACELEATLKKYSGGIG